MDIQVSCSWNDYRLDYNGSNVLEVPAFEYEDKCSSKDRYCKEHHYEMLKPPIWIPSYQFRLPANETDRILDDFINIENVSY